MFSRTLVICPHMDDEALSCGGLILTRTADSDAQVRVIVLSGRVYDYARETEEQSYSEEYADFVASMDVLGVKSFSAYNLPEGEPAKVGYYTPLEIIEKNLQTFQPTEVVIPSACDLNQDHRHYNHVCRIALRPANLGSVVRVLESYAFDSSEGVPNFFVPLSDSMLFLKLLAVSKYRREWREGTHSRSKENITAVHRVLGAKVGVALAEGYSLILQKGV